MLNKLPYILVFLILTIACWLIGTIFFGSMNLTESTVILIVVALMVTTLAPAARSASHKVLIPTGLTILAGLVSSFMLFFALSGRQKLAGLLYLLIIPSLIAVSSRAQNVDFHQLTDERAERVSQGIETYYVRVGRYPEDLHALTPWYIFPFPGPVIIYGGDWCYDAGESHYRLGYVYRQHWSDPRLIGRIYKESGDAPYPNNICEAEIAALQERYPDYPYEYWVDAE